MLHDARHRMPTYLDRLEIDWGWPLLTEPERAVVRRHEARVQADPRTHSLTTIKEAMADASRELPFREIRCRVTDAFGVYVFAARGGRCTNGSAFDENGMFQERIGVDDFRAAGVDNLSVALFWPDDMIDAVKEQAARLDRSLSWIVQRAWRVADSRMPTAAAARPPRDGAPRKQSVYLPLDIYEELRERATREDCSMSTLVQQALALAWPTITELPAGS